MNTARVSYTLKSSLESVCKAEQATAEAAARSGFDVDECSRITMAAREAIVNAVMHGNRYDPTKRVSITLESAPSVFSVVVRDEGAGFDPATLPDPVTSENLLGQTGRGIFLIRSFMDEVRFRSLSPGTELSMIKFLPGRGISTK